MRYLPDGEQMKAAADTHTIEELGVPSLVLMERAALEVVETMEKKGIDTSKALVVCGSGNNGGDGFAAARILTERGRQADSCLCRKGILHEQGVQDPETDAENMGLRIFTEFPSEEYTVIIDAVFGVGRAGDQRARYDRTDESCAGPESCRRYSLRVCAQIRPGAGNSFPRGILTVGMACTKLGCELYPGKYYAGGTAADLLASIRNSFRTETRFSILMKRSSYSPAPSGQKTRFP
ncbi:MAG: NAD(P)H-hydrate epimerase [Lachnoclostridium sp.]